MPKNRNFKTKICSLCNKPFKPTSGKQIYCGSQIKRTGCSFEVYKKNGIEYSKKYKKTEKYKKWSREYGRKYRRRRQERNDEDKNTVLKYYGGEFPKCAVCGIDIIDVLVIDHIENNGAKERKKLNIRGGRPFYCWLIKNNFPDGYQVLCRNCNWLKHLDYKNNLKHFLKKDLTRFLDMIN